MENLRSFRTSFPQYILLMILILSISTATSISNPRISEASLTCGNASISGPQFIPNFTKLMGRLKDLISINKWATYSITSSPALHGFAQCHGDLTNTDCNLCFSAARGKLSTCLPSSFGSVFLDGCYATYSGGTTTTYNQSDMECSLPSGVLRDAVVKLAFERKLAVVLENVTRVAVTGGGFAMAEMKGGVTSVYALAQCWMNVDGVKCKGCLEEAKKKVVKCVPGNDGRVMNEECFLRYSTDKFFGLHSEFQDKSRFSIIIGSVLGAAAVTLLLIFGAFVGYKRLSKKREEKNIQSWVSERVVNSSLSFKYETLEKATNFFDAKNKLGQGGAGSVFKGTLPDGKVVAVKRLFYSTRQWVDEFFNEVNLISGAQHKNLVKLLGCSIEGQESLLVYEYVLNGSLDQFFNDKEKTQTLNWQHRIGIIYGTADGLAYLHGGSTSPLKIIHRDIKGSNILLDENLTPKIADFGLVRGLDRDKSHVSTGIAGTLGYMAPEYLVRGQLTEKADVYAFGVLVLEIVCGRKNSVFSSGSSSVLQNVWNHYKLNRLPETVDPVLKGDFLAQQASNVLQIGLLCTQASAALRPSMSEVLQMLTVAKTVIPTPQQPPFLNSSVLGTDTTSKTFTMSVTSIEGSSAAAACPEPNGLSDGEKAAKKRCVNFVQEDGL